MAEKKIAMQSAVKVTNETKIDAISNAPINSTKIKDDEVANAANVADDIENKSIDTTEATKDIDEIKTEPNEPTNKAQVKEHSSAINKAKYVVEYIAGGIWKDAKGEYWANKNIVGTNIANTRAYIEAEYDSRDDLRFMVQYGSMKATKVTL